MKRTNLAGLAALMALSLPAAASADDRFERDGHDRRGPAPVWAPAPAPAPGPASRGERGDVRELRLLVERYDAAMARRDRFAMARIEAAVLRALDEEIAEARHDRQGRWNRGVGPRGELRRLVSLRGELVSLEGRYGWRATQAKRAVAVEVTRIAQADLFRPSGAPAVAHADRFDRRDDR